MKDSKGMAADTVHKAIVNQEKVDEEIVRRADYERKRSLRNAIKRSLRPVTGKISGYDGQLFNWFMDKLTGCAAFGFVDKSKISVRAMKVVEMHYSRGIPFEEVAKAQFISLTTAIRDANVVLDYIVTHAPKGVLASICKDVFRWKPGECPHCGCDLFWDEQGAYQMPEGNWVGLMCARRYWANGEPVIKELI